LTTSGEYSIMQQHKQRNNKMSSKSPYEIRSDLLHLAYSIVQGQKQANAEQEAKSEGTAQIFITSAPTTEEVVTEATKLNNFVSQSSSP